MTQNSQGFRWGRLFVLSGLALVTCAVLIVYLGPRFLAREATRSPEQAGTFVTRSIEQKPLQFKLQDALRQPPSDPPATLSRSSDSETQDPVPEQNTITEQGVVQTYELQTKTDTEVDTETESEESSSSDAETFSRIEPEKVKAHSAVATPPKQLPSPQNTAATHASNQQFSVQISENDISSLIYSGLSQGIAPEFRSALQGVSTRIQSGRATISVALLPKYLPEAFLKNLPGVTHQTPTIYLGGDVSLAQKGNTVQPVIHRINLGAIRVPLPFIQSAMQSQVQAYVRQMLTLPDGRQAQLSQVQLQSGAIHLNGFVD